MLPATASRCRRLRRLRHPEIGPFSFFDPTDVWRPWRIASTGTTAVFVLESAFGSPSRVERCSKVELV